MKVSRYNVYTPALVGEATLVYNTFTGSFRAFENTEFERVLSTLEAVDERTISEPHTTILAELLECGFVVPQGQDEASAVRERYWSKDSGVGHALSLTIAPTVSCNFGCSYCFQEHPNRTMKEEDIQAIKDYVAARIEAAGSLHILWFGGEPLIAFRVIEQLNEFFTELSEKTGTPYSQSMITNGMLLAGKRLEFFERQPNVGYVQITLDGPPEVHDRRRLLVSGKPTFATILENIVAAADTVPISIRVNVDNTNADRVENLLDVLLEAGLRDRVSVYLGHVQSFTEACEGVEQTGLTTEEFAAVESNFALAQLERGFRPNVSLPKPHFGSQCVADHPGGAVLAPEKLVFRCWNEVAETAEHASGTLNGGDVDSTPQQAETRAKWDQYDPFTHEECQTCAVQPLCSGGCPWEARKQPTEGPGHCTSLRYNIADRLRLYHLLQTIDAHPGPDPSELADARCG